MITAILRSSGLKTELQRIGVKNMGGRGAIAGGARGGGGLGGLGGALGGMPVAPPNVQPGQPVPAITIQQLQAMNDTEFVNYLNGLKSTPIDRLTYYNNDWDTQRLIANMPELNRAPAVVDPQSFATLPGQALYRTVNASGTESALDIAARTMTSDVTTIGQGRMGDGFYFATSKSVSQQGYGNNRNNINKTATMAAKLNSNASIISERDLDIMVSREKPSVRAAISNMRSGGMWPRSGYMAYALHKGYNVVQANGVLNVIDRNALTWSGEVIPVS